MSNLNEYYTIRQSTDKALDRYLELVKERRWDIGGQDGKLQLYSLASDAFESRTRESESLEAFRKLYDVLRNWPGVQRGGSLAPAEEVFDVLLRDGSSFFYGTEVSLANLTYPSDEARSLKELLPSLRFLKHASGYPWMAVSKVLHFANPSLFPIWDWDVIWKRVMHGAFHTEYKKYCHDLWL